MSITRHECGHIAVRIALLIGVCVLTGCAAVAPQPSKTPVVDNYDREASRTKQVFFYQSRVADALLTHYPLFDIFTAEAEPALISAEARMTESCAYLNEAALMHAEGRKLPLRLKLNVMRTLRSCETDARTVAMLLQSKEPRLVDLAVGY